MESQTQFYDTRLPTNDGLSHSRRSSPIPRAKAKITYRRLGAPLGPLSRRPLFLCLLAACLPIKSEPSCTKAFSRVQQTRQLPAEQAGHGIGFPDVGGHTR